METKDFENSQDNVLTDEHGNKKDIESIVVEGEEGTLTCFAAGCVISYVNCRTKKTEIVSLQKGDTFAYGDWNGTRCVRKVYTC